MTVDEIKAAIAAALRGLGHSNIEAHAGPDGLTVSAQHDRNGEIFPVHVHFSPAELAIEDQDTIVRMIEARARHTLVHVNSTIRMRSHQQAEDDRKRKVQVAAGEMERARQKTMESMLTENQQLREALREAHRQMAAERQKSAQD